MSSTEATFVGLAWENAGVVVRIPNVNGLKNINLMSRLNVLSNIDGTHTLGTIKIVRDRGSQANECQIERQIRRQNRDKFSIFSTYRYSVCSH